MYYLSFPPPLPPHLFLQELLVCPKSVWIGTHCAIIYVHVVCLHIPMYTTINCVFAVKGLKIYIYIILEWTLFFFTGCCMLFFFFCSFPSSAHFSSTMSRKRGAKEDVSAQATAKEAKADYGEKVIVKKKVCFFKLIFIFYCMLSIFFFINKRDWPP